MIRNGKFVIRSEAEMEHQPGMIRLCRRPAVAEGPPEEGRGGFVIGREGHSRLCPYGNQPSP